MQYVRLLHDFKTVEDSAPRVTKVFKHHEAKVKPLKGSQYRRQKGRSIQETGRQVRHDAHQDTDNYSGGKKLTRIFTKFKCTVGGPERSAVSTSEPA